MKVFFFVVVPIPRGDFSMDGSTPALSSGEKVVDRTMCPKSLLVSV